MTANPIKPPITTGSPAVRPLSVMSRHTTGTPPRVRPINKLYITQRWLTTRFFTGPASSTMDNNANTTTLPSTVIEARRNFSGGHLADRRDEPRVDPGRQQHRPAADARHEIRQPHQNASETTAKTKLGS